MLAVVPMLILRDLLLIACSWLRTFQMSFRERSLVVSSRTILLTSWSDGENGGWFRQMDASAGFWGYFFAPLMDMVQAKETAIQPIKISDYLKKFPPQKYATVRTGAWNVGSTSGYDEHAGSSRSRLPIVNCAK